MKELWERARKVWYKTSQEKCIKLIDSMPQRVAAVLKAKGGYKILKFCTEICYCIKVKELFQCIVKL